MRRWTSSRSAACVLRSTTKAVSRQTNEAYSAERGPSSRGSRIRPVTSCPSSKRASRGWSKGYTPRVDRAGRHRPAVPALLHGPDRPEPGGAQAQRGAEAEQRSAPVDRGHLRLPDRRIADHDGHVGRSHRPPPASLDWRRSVRSEEHTSELQSRLHLVCRLLLEKKNNNGEIIAFKPDRYLYLGMGNVGSRHHPHVR